MLLFLQCFHPPMPPCADSHPPPLGLICFPPSTQSANQAGVKQDHGPHHRHHHLCHHLLPLPMSYQGSVKCLSYSRHAYIWIAVRFVTFVMAEIKVKIVVMSVIYFFFPGRQKCLLIRLFWPVRQNVCSRFHRLIRIQFLEVPIHSSSCALSIQSFAFS